MDPTVMCAAYTQRETRMDGGGGAAAAKQEYERELEMHNQKLELEEELAVSKTLTSDLMLNVNSLEQQENTRRSLSSGGQTTVGAAVADFLKKFIIMERDAKK
jgi:hypothetical protein